MENILAGKADKKVEADTISEIKIKTKILFTPSISSVTTFKTQGGKTPVAPGQPGQHCGEGRGDQGRRGGAVHMNTEVEMMNARANSSQPVRHFKWVGRTNTAEISARTGQNTRARQDSPLAGSEAGCEGNNLQMGE